MDTQTVVTGVTRPSRAVDRLAVVFYGAAAAAAAIGQTQVGLERIGFPDHWPAAGRVLAVAPFAATLELLAVVLLAMADQRLRLGERALALRVASGAVAVVAVGINVLGHHDPYWSTVFGFFSGAAYVLACLHTGARRRDALRAAGLTAAVTPSYGLVQWLRHPALTARAAELARTRGLGRRESLEAAAAELRAERRRPAIAAAVERAVRAAHRDRRMADIAVTTLDLDRLAEELEQAADYSGWVRALLPAVSAPDTAPDMSAPEAGHGPDIGADTEPDMERTSSRTWTADIGTQQADMSAPGRRTRGGHRSGHGSSKKAGRAAKAAGTVTADHLRELLDQHPDMTQRQLAQLVGLSDRQVRRLLKRQLGPQADMSAPEAGHGPDIGADTEPDMDGGHVRLNGHAMSG